MAHPVVRRRRRRVTAAAAAAAAALLWAAAAATGAAQVAEKFLLGAGARPNLSNAAIYAAQEAGFMRDQGLDLEWVFLDGEAVILPQLAAKRIDAAWITPGAVLVSHDTGKDPYPARFFYNMTHRYNWELAVPAGSPIQTIADLKGKTIGVFSISGGNMPMTRVMLQRAGLDPSRDVSYVAFGSGPSSLVAIRSGQVDVSNLFDVIHSQWTQAGFPMRKLAIPEEFLTVSANAFAAHSDAVSQNPDRLVRFGRAISQGLLACEANPEGCVRMTWRLFPVVKPTTGTEEQQMADAIQQFNTNLGFKIPPGRGCQRDWGWGQMRPEGMRVNYDALLAAGVMQRKDVDLDKIYTNALVPRFGEFDCQATLARAAQIR